MALFGKVSEFIPFISKHKEFDREEAVKRYLESGGIVKIEEVDGELILKYPTVHRINKLLFSLNSRISFLESELKKLRQEEVKLNQQMMAAGLVKLVDPLYWEHFVKYAVNGDYKKSFDEIKPPIDLIKYPRFRRILKNLLRNPEYRRNLLEAKRTGNIELFEDLVKKSLGFRKKLITERISKLQDEILDLKERRRVLFALHEWAKESEGRIRHYR